MSNMCPKVSTLMLIWKSGRTHPQSHV